MGWCPTHWATLARERNCKLMFLKRFWERGEEKEKERERNIHVWLPLTCPLLGSWLQPRHVPWLGIKPVTLWFTGKCSIHWATPARERNYKILKAGHGMPWVFNKCCWLSSIYREQRTTSARVRAKTFTWNVTWASRECGFSASCGLEEKWLILSQDIR